MQENITEWPKKSDSVVTANISDYYAGGLQVSFFPASVIVAVTMATVMATVVIPTWSCLQMENLAEGKF